jgi:DNA-binding beta-propeller fold protein YncE
MQKKHLFVSHKISFSDMVFGTPGTIDCEGEDIVSIGFKNQGTRDVLVNGVIVKPDDSREYVVQDESNIIYKFNYGFVEVDGTGAPIAGTNNLVITRAKRIRSEAYLIPIIDKC